MVLSEILETRVFETSCWWLTELKTHRILGPQPCIFCNWLMDNTSCPQRRCGVQEKEEGKKRENRPGEGKLIWKASEAVRMASVVSMAQDMNKSFHSFPPFTSGVFLHGICNGRGY